MIFLTVARLLYDKGYSELVEAAREVRRSHPEMTFQWLGGIDEGYPERVSRERVEADHGSGVITYLDFVKDVTPYVRKADCIVLPSYHEGMSRTLMEATSMSKPIITTDIPGCREAVDEGVNGFLCKPRDAESLVAAILKFVALPEEERLKMGAASRRKAERRFDVRLLFPIYEKVVEEGIGRRKSR